MNAEETAESAGARLSAAKRAALLFALASLAWIVLSDVLLEWTVADRTTLHWLELAGGLVYVILVAAALYLVLRRDLLRVVHSEEALWERAARYRELVESMNDGLAIKDAYGLLAFVNDKFCSMVGYEREELIGRPLAAFVDAAHRMVFDQENVKRRSGEDRPYEMALTSKGGKLIPVIVSPRPLFDARGGFKGSLAVFTDISERVAAEEALRLTKASVDRASVAIYWLDPQGRVLYANQAACRALGYTPEELLKLSVLDFDHCCTPESWAIHWQKLKQDGERTRERQHRTKDGRVFPVEIAGNYVKIGDKEYDFVFVRDLTERQRAEEVLHEREETLRLLFEQAWDGINMAEYDLQTGKRRLVACNQRYVEMTGRTLDDLLAADNLNDLVEYPHSSEERQEWYRKICAGVPFSGTASWKRPDGKENHYEFTAAPVRKGEKVYIFGVDRDITERRQAEAEKARLAQQVLQSQKLEALGTLAGGVAHDFNNLLTGILGYASLLKADALPDSEVARGAEAIETTARRAAQLTGQLLAFARKGKRENVAVDMHQTIADLTAFLTRALGERTALRLDLAAPACIVRGDPGRLEQVLFNLAVNARDAMPDGGEFLIRTAVADVREGDRSVPAGLKTARYLVLSASDTGCGIPEDIRDRIFEPFFTTKDPGKSTGLGLALVYGVVSDHDGAVQVHSALGRGSTFEVYLPLAAGQAAAVGRPGAPGSAELVRGSGRILLVDDDQVVRDATGRMLRELGYEAIVMADAREAVEYFRRSPDEVDLVIADVGMAHMSGLECLRALREIRPQVRVLLSTGRALDADAEKLLADPGAAGLGFIQKPYGVQQLGAVVSRALARSGGGDSGRAALA